jgi:hypothetical protein
LAVSSNIGYVAEKVLSALDVVKTGTPANTTGAIRV